MKLIIALCGGQIPLEVAFFLASAEGKEVYHPPFLFNKVASSLDFFAFCFLLLSEFFLSVKGVLELMQDFLTGIEIDVSNLGCP